EHAQGTLSRDELGRLAQALAKYDMAGLKSVTVGTPQAPNAGNPFGLAPVAPRGFGAGGFGQSFGSGTHEKTLIFGKQKVTLTLHATETPESREPDPATVPGRYHGIARAVEQLLPAKAIPENGFAFPAPFGFGPMK